jgi:uncharacterized membrane protein
MTEGRDVPGDDEAPSTGGDEPREPGEAATEAPAADLTDPAPSPIEAPAEPLPAEAPPEPPTIGWATGVQWEPNDYQSPVRPPAGIKLDVGSVLRRTFDTFIRHWSLFVVLAIPSAVVSAVSAFILRATTSVGFTFFVSLGSLAVGIIFTLAMIVATDDLRAGRPFTRGSVIGRGADRTVAAFLSTLAEGLAYFGIFFLPAVIAFVAIGSIARGAGAGAGGVVGVLLLIGAVVAIAAVAIRWSLADAAIVLDGFGPLQGLNRSRAVTKGNAWRLFGLNLVLGLLFLPLTVGLGALSLSELSPVVFVLLAFSSLITTPLTAIATSTAYGDLTARPAVEPIPATTGNGRGILIGAILAVGVVALVLGVPNIGPGLSRLSPGFVPAEDRGRILVGTTRNPLDPCMPSGVASTFTTSDTLYIGGYFTKPIPAGQSGTVDVYANGTKANSAPLSDPTRPVACYAERDALVGAAPGTYRIVITYGGETIGEGSFAVR